MKHYYLGFALVVVALTSCSQEPVTVRQDVGSGARLELYHNASYSTKEGEVGEAIGTMTATYTQVEFKQEGENTILTRTYMVDRSKGYHKHSMPKSLSYRIPQVILTAEGNKVKSVRGNEAFIPKVVDHLPIKEFFKRQLRDARYQLEFDRYDKRRYEIGHLLIGSYQPNINITAQLKQQGRLPIPAFEVDSVLTRDLRKVDGRVCFEYTVFYNEREPFPYFMWEQYAYSTESGAPYKEYKADSARYQVEYSVALEPETSLPCQEREVIRGKHYMSHKETKETATFDSYITLENLYTKEK